MADENRCIQQAAIEAMQQRLKNGHQDFREMRSDIKQLLQDVAALKERARNWGAIAGTVVAVGINVAFLVIRMVWS